MLQIKMHWDALVDYDGQTQVRMGIHIYSADDEEDAVRQALHFLHNGAFLDWDAFIEDGKDLFVDLGCM